MAKTGKSKKQKEKPDIIKGCATWVYYKTIDWCVALKNTDIHKRCMLELIENLEDGKGLLCREYPFGLTMDWSENYWYDTKNHRHYTKQQLKKVEKEFDNGRTSDELCEEMMQFVWFNMVDDKYMDEEIDDNVIYKIRIKFIK